MFLRELFCGSKMFLDITYHIKTTVIEIIRIWWPLYGSDGKTFAYNVGNLGSMPGLGRSPGERNGSPLQNSCLENPMDRQAWYAIVHGVTKSRTQLSNFTSFHFITEGARSDIKKTVLFLTLPSNLAWDTCHFGSHIIIYRARWMVRKTHNWL